MPGAFSVSIRTRHPRVGGTVAAAGVLLVLALAPARLAAWPADNGWLPLTRDGKVVVDPVGDISNVQPSRDVVGCAADPTIAVLTCASGPDNPAVAIASDAESLYFRLRVSSNPGTTGQFQFGYGCQISTNGILNNSDHCYEKMVVLDKAVSIDAYTNPASGCSNSPGDSANTLISATPETADNARSVAAALGFFVDFAIARTTLQFSASTPMTFVCGTNSNGGNVFTTGGSADIVNNNDATTDPLWSAIRSDEYLCADLGCARCPFAPAFLSADSVTFEIDSANTFQVAAFACPPAALSATGTLPDGITFDNVTGVLGGATTVDFLGDYALTFTASNGEPDDAMQAFTLRVTLPDKIFADAFEAPP